MASPVPSKSQPLHNFSLPQLKWKKNQTNHLHGRRRSTASSPQRHPSPLPSNSKLLHILFKNTKSPEEEDNHPNNPTSPKREQQQQEQELENDKDDQEKGGLVESYDFGEVVEPKTWNLRPRKPLKKQNNGSNGGAVRIQENKATIRAEAVSDRVGKEKEKEKKKFSVTLERDEIEEDIFLMTGSRPSRKPKKRAKHVQKNVDNLLPGMWLSEITCDCYKVADAPMKG